MSVVVSLSHSVMRWLEHQNEKKRVASLSSPSGAGDEQLFTQLQLHTKHMLFFI